jgi:hypothetical protein
VVTKERKRKRKKGKRDREGRGGGGEKKRKGYIGKVREGGIYGGKGESHS